MTQRAKYYLEEIRESEDSDGGVVILISTEKHGACIEIYGTRQTATDRMMVILEAFNKEDPSE